MTHPFVVVVGTDYSKQAERAIRLAHQYALRAAPAELHVAHASLAVTPQSSDALTTSYGESSPTSLQSLEEQQAHLVKYLDDTLGSLTAAHCRQVKVFTHIVSNAPAFGLTHLAKVLAADLLVVGTHGHQGVTRWLLGSVAESTVRQVACPVLVIPPESNEETPRATSPSRRSP